MRKPIIAIALVALAPAASADNIRLDKGAIVDHPNRCNLATLEWLQKIIDRDPLIVCTRVDGHDTMTIKIGREDPLAADSVDGTTGHWRLNDETTMVISIDPFRHPNAPGVTVGLLKRADEKECSERWVGRGIFLRVAR